MVSFELQFSVFHSHHNLQPKDPITVWHALQRHDKTYELAHFAKMILTVVVNQAGCEWAFSDLKIKQTQHHN